MNEYGPCLILIDEWVAYARQLHEQSDDLPGESSETQFSFAQALTSTRHPEPQFFGLRVRPCSGEELP